MDFQMSKKIKVKDLSGLVTCIICNGYFIDATTISECLHSFCRTCIVRYLQTNKSCPICEVQVHKVKPLLSIRSDQTLQDIVYKIVPDLFKNEMKRRRDFYAHSNFLNGANIPVSSEKRGDVEGCDRLIFTPEDLFSISMEYCSQNLSFSLLLHTESNEHFEGPIPDVSSKKVHRRYFQCPGAVSIRHLKRLLRTKYGLANAQEIDIMYMHDQLGDEYTLIDLAYIYSWRRNAPLRLFYKFPDAAFEGGIKYHGPCIIPAMSEQLTVLSNGSSLTSPVPSAAAAPSSYFLRPLSPPASPQMATEPDNSKLENPKPAAMQNRLARSVESSDPSKMTMRSEKPKMNAKEKNVVFNRLHARRNADSVYVSKSKVKSPKKLHKSLRNGFKRSNSYNSRHRTEFYEKSLGLNGDVKVVGKETVKHVRKNSL